MSELLSYRRIVKGGAVICGAIALAGCANERDARSHMNIQERIGFDYGGWDAQNSSVARHDTCLEDSPYEPSEAIISTYMDDSGHLVAELIPNKVEASKFILSLVGFRDVRHPLQPANEQSASILQTYGCNTKD